MAILEGCIARWKSYPKDEIKIRVAAPSTLGPSMELLNQYKAKDKTPENWEGYKTEFLKQLADRPVAINRLREIAEMSKTKNVRLICFEGSPPCHRFILMDIVKALQGEDGQGYDDLRKTFGKTTT